VEDTVIRGLICTLLAAFLQPGACAPASGQTPGGPPPLPADTAAIEQAIEAALVNRVEAGRGVGLVVGILTPEGRRFLTHGRTVQGGDLEPGPDTVFEIGSISKVFTSLLLARNCSSNPSLVTASVKYLSATRFWSSGCIESAHSDGFR
jgi:CubicO group peptidase (beta-lactamase class C family)